MQMVKPISMGSALITNIMHLFPNLGNNKISKSGCKWLSKANWKQLNTIRLSNNQII